MQYECNSLKFAIHCCINSLVQQLNRSCTFPRTILNFMISFGPRTPLWMPSNSSPSTYCIIVYIIFSFTYIKYTDPSLLEIFILAYSIYGTKYTLDRSAPMGRGLLVAWVFLKKALLYVSLLFNAEWLYRWSKWAILKKRPQAL